MKSQEIKNKKTMLKENNVAGEERGTLKCKKY